MLILTISADIKCKCCPDIETSQLICTANQFNGFYMRTTMAFNELITINGNNLLIYLLT